MNEQKNLLHKKFKPVSKARFSFILFWGQNSYNITEHCFFCRARPFKEWLTLLMTQHAASADCHFRWPHLFVDFPYVSKILVCFFFSKSGFRNSCFNEKVIRTNSSWTLAHWLLILDCLFIVVKKTNPTGWQRKITWAMGNHINFLRAYNSQPDWPGARYKERSLDIQ